MTIKLTDEERKLAITDAKKLYPIFQKIYDREEDLGLKKEHFWVVGLNYAGYLLYIELAAIGSANRVAVRPTDVYQLALMRGAGTIIVAHNHPSGLLKFSQEDIDLTDKLVQVGKLIDIDLVDHLIITKKGFTSLRMGNLYDEVYNSPKYLNDYVMQEIALVRERANARKELQERIRMMAGIMHRKNIPLEDIAEIVDVEPYELRRILEID